jgi:death on curing protein
MKCLSPEQVLFIHSRLIDETGGMHSIRDLGLLESAIARPLAAFNDKELYPTIFHKAAALAESLVKNHPFIDGNKRTAITATALFLQINGYTLKASQRELVDFTLALATKKSYFDRAAECFKEYCS